jgi:hypothetical protein
MAEIVAQTAQLSNDDRLAIATYLKSVPAVDAPAPGIPEPNRTSEVVILAKTHGGRRQLQSSIQAVSYLPTTA